MGKKGNTGLFTALLPFIGAAGVAASDIYIKEWMEAEIPKTEDEEIKKGIFRFRKYHNRGAFMNLGQKYPSEVTGMSIFGVAITFISLCFAAGKKGGAFEKTGLALILGGAISNTFDRIKKHYVMDYVSLDVKNNKVRNVIFNLSDVAIGLGTLLVTISNLTANDRVL